MWSALVCGLTHHRWWEKLLNSNWLHNNYELDCKKIIKYTDITDFINLGKVLRKIQCRQEKLHKAHSTKDSGRDRRTNGNRADILHMILIIKDSMYGTGIHTTQNLVLQSLCFIHSSIRSLRDITLQFNPYPTAFPYGNGMVLHFYQQQESSTTKTVHKVINKGLKTYV